VNQAIKSLSGTSTGVVTNLTNPTGVTTPATAVLTVSNGGIFNGAIVDGSVSGVTTGLNVTGGSLSLGGAGLNTYSGSTTVGTGATLMGTASNSLSPNSATTIVANGFLDLDGTSQAIGSLAGAGTVQNVATGTATLTTGGNNASTTFSGVIKDDFDTLAVNKVGTGTMVLSGTNTYSGGTTIAAGAVQVTNNNSVGIGLVSLNGGVFQSAAAGLSFANTFALGSVGGTVDTQANTLTLAGAIGGGLNGVLNKSGIGTLVLSGTSNYTGPTNLNAGTLSVLGDTSSSSLLTVNANGVLSGTGTVGNTTIAGGILTPGSAAKPTGMLHINGDLTLSAASLYMVAINGSNSANPSSMASVTGTATLNGASLNIATSNIQIGTAYTILASTNTINGTFGTTTVTGTTLNDKITYGKSAQVTFTSPSQVAGQSTYFADANAMQNSFSTTLLNPNTGTRAAGGFGPVLGFAPEIPQTPEEQAAYSAVTPRNPLDAVARAMNPTYSYSHNVWASAYGGYSSVSGDTTIGSSTATTRGGGVASGVDFRVGPDTVLGFALGGGGTSWSLSNGISSGTSDIFQAGFYGSQRLGNAYISGSIAYAYDHLKDNRTTTTMPVANLTSSFNLNGATGRLEGGYRFDMKDIGVTPYGAAQFSAMRSPAYSETTASGAPGFGLTYAAQTTTNVRGEAGVWVDKTLVVNDTSTLLLRGRVAYAHDWWSNDFLSASFIALPTQSFTAVGITPPANLALLSAMSEFRLKNGVSLGLKVDGEIASGAYSIAGTGTFRYSW
jgi:autotransporter-associated beta strand protein